MTTDPGQARRRAAGRRSPRARAARTPGQPDAASAADAPGSTTAGGPPGLPGPGDWPQPQDHPASAGALRVLAHPLRSRILAELRALGEATASDLARLLDTSSGVTSYHLRALARTGLITASAARGRRRYWRIAPGSRLASLDDPGPDDEASAEWLARDYIQHFAGKAQQWITAAPSWPPDWQELCGLDDHLVLVTDTQLAALQDDMVTLLAKYRRAGAGNPAAKRVTYYTCALPVGPPPRW